MLKRKKIISRLIATTMITTSIASMFAVNASALSVSTSTLAGANRYETAIKISESGWTTATNAVLINGDKGLVDALTATPYASLKNAPILITEKDKLTTATKTRLTKMNVKNVDIVGGTSVVSTAVENELKAMGITVNRLAGDDRFKTSVKVAEAMDKISDVSKIAVVNGWTGLPDAVSIAAPAAKNKMPIILSDPKVGVSEAKDFINREAISRTYVVGQTSAVADSIMNSLPGTKTRLGGVDRHDTNAKVIKEFYTTRALDNIYVAKSGYVKNNEELVDALAVGVLAAKNDDPVLIVGNNLGDTQKTLLSGKEFTKITQVGNGIPTQSINDIKNTQADVEAKVTGVSMVNYKTIELRGTDLDKLSSSSVSMSGNSVSSYTADSSTRATVVFNSAFNDGTNTVRVTSNLGNTTSHTFTYSSSISSVEASTKDVGPSSTSGVQYLEFTVNNGQKRTVEELKANGWNVEFKSSKEIFYKDSTSGKKTSNDGKLVTTGLVLGDIFDYQVILTKGSQIIQSSKSFVEVVNKSDQYKEIKSYKVKTNNNIKLNSSTLVSGETATIVDMEVVDKTNTTIKLSDAAVKNGFTVTSSNSAVVSVDSVDSGSSSVKNRLRANGVGTATITITNGTISKSFNVSVSDKSREASSISLSSTTINLMKGKSGTVTATVKDQYGDPKSGHSLDLNNVNILNPAKDVIATVASTINTNTDGETTISITTNSNTGSGNLSMKINNVVKSTLYINVGNVDSANAWRLELKSGQKDTIIDKYTPTGGIVDNTVTLELNGYNGTYFVDKEKTNINVVQTLTNSGFEIISSNKDVVSVAVTSVDGLNKGDINITALKAGSTTLSLYKDGQFKHSISITVKDSTPEIKDIKIKELSTITSVKNNYDVINALFDITEVSNSESVVGGLTISGTEEKVNYIEGTDSTNPIFCIERGSDDLTLATIEVINDFGATVNNDRTVNIEANKTGNIIVKVYKGDGTTGSPFKTIVVKVNTYQ